MADLHKEFIRCRDALACAINWLEQDPEHPDSRISVPPDRLQWLNEQLDAATKRADELARWETDTKPVFGAAVLNDYNQILPYTAQSTVSQCEEKAIERWGEELWAKLQDRGCRIIQIQIIHFPTALNP